MGSQDSGCGGVVVWRINYLSCFSQKPENLSRVFLFPDRNDC